MCALVLIAWGHSYFLGYHKICYYDCGSKRYGYYDVFYRVSPEYYCPVRLETA